MFYGVFNHISALKFCTNILFLIILYFNILLHCIVQWLLQVMFPFACSFIVFWFSLSFTTCLYIYEESYTHEDGHVGRNM
jgi:hypothetical protein